MVPQGKNHCPSGGLGPALAVKRDFVSLVTSLSQFVSMKCLGSWDDKGDSLLTGDFMGRDRKCAVLKAAMGQLFFSAFICGSGSMLENGCSPGHLATRWRVGLSLHGRWRD